MAALTVPKAFIWRRLHSLMGLWLVVFLSEHLLTHSQAALWLGQEGQGFVRMVNALHNLPYLEVVELTLLGIPLLIHLYWGVRYALTSKPNNGKTDGSTPSIPTPRNRAYSWQRITSWILLVCLIGHVVKFRFLDYPEELHSNGNSYYAVKISSDPKLPQVAKRLDVLLYDARLEASGALQKLDLSSLKENEVFAVSKEFGKATLLSVRDTFKNPFYIGVYMIFVFAACFHAFNGLWTFLLTWGWILKMSAQRAWTSIAVCLMALFIFLGLSAIWGSYWINLGY